MDPTARKILLSVHLLASVGWIGAILAYLPLDITTAASDDADLLRASYAAMDLIARFALVPLALASLASGIAISLLTPWGLFRHWWVLISLLLTLLACVVLLVETRVIAALAQTAVDPATSAEALRALPSTLPHSVGGLAVLTVVLAINVHKPRGLTRYGWRKEKDARRP